MEPPSALLSSSSVKEALVTVGNFLSQAMVETCQIIDNSFDRLCSNMDRQMDQLFEAVNENQKSFDELKRVLKPMMDSRYLSIDGIGLTSKNGSGDTIFPLDRGQAAKVRYPKTSWEWIMSIYPLWIRFSVHRRHGGPNSQAKLLIEKLGHLLP
ncbi:hypothetical protein LINGRAHAP2_LOCUS36368 [Linum grandiflorum]